MKRVENDHAERQGRDSQRFVPPLESPRKTRQSCFSHLQFSTQLLISVVRQNLLQIRRHFCDGRFSAFHQATFANDDVVFLLPAWIDIRVIDAAVALRGFPFGPGALR